MKLKLFNTYDVFDWRMMIWEKKNIFSSKKNKMCYKNYLEFEKLNCRVTYTFIKIKYILVNI